MLLYLDGDAVQAMESALLRGGGSCSAWMEHRPLAPTHRRPRWGIFISRAIVVVGLCAPSLDITSTSSASQTRS